MAKEKINIDELKAKYGELKVIECDGMTAYFRKPDMKIWRFAMKAFEKSTTQFKISLATNCFVAGDRDLLKSPFIEDVSEIIDEFVDYDEAEVEKDGNAYVVKVKDKSCRLKSLTIEMQTMAERDNPEKIAFKDQQNLLNRMWIEGDDELRSEKFLDYHMPVLNVLKKLREKHVVSIKNA